MDKKTDIDSPLCQEEGHKTALYYGGKSNTWLYGAFMPTVWISIGALFEYINFPEDACINNKVSLNINNTSYQDYYPYEMDDFTYANMLKPYKVSDLGDNFKWSVEKDGFIVPTPLTLQIVDNGSKKFEGVCTFNIFAAGRMPGGLLFSKTVSIGTEVKLNLVYNPLERPYGMLHFYETK